VKPSYEILSLDNDVLSKLELFGRVCYKSEDKITESSAPRFCKMILSKKHESVIEHASMSVRFIIDRGVSHELVRHRLCSFSQESTRYCNYKGGVTFVIPPWLDLEPGEWDKNRVFDYIHLATSYHWLHTMLTAENNYVALTKQGWTPQQARSVLPNSLKTEIIVTANLREWRHIFRMRCAPDAHPQMREVMVPLLKDVRGKIPVLFEEYNDETLQN
jgi:thymidylate synthase (FAD)